MDDVGVAPGMAIPSDEGLPVGSRSRARIARWALCAGLVAASGAVALALSSDHVRYRWGDALFLANNIAGFSAAGAYWYVRRPRSLLGGALLASAAIWVLVALQSADDSLVFSLAVLADWPLTVATVYTLLAVPSGRLSGRLDRAAIALVFLVLTLFFLPYVLLSPVTTGGHPLAECRDLCPSNALQVGSISTQTLIDIGRAESIGAVVVGALVCFELVRRFLTGTRPRRRALFWIVVVGVPYATLFALRQLTAFVIDAPPGVVETVRWALAAVRVLLPWAFVASLLRAEVFAGAALKRLVAGLEHHPDARRWERDVADALDDPSLRIAVWSETEHSYLGVDGAAIRPGGPPFGWHAIDDHLGGHVAVILHDPVLDEDPELLEAAGTATLVSLESGRLEAEIRRARLGLLAVGEAERRRLERDLQEGAEQRLVALRVKLGLVGAVSEDQFERLIAEIGDELDATMDDLRQVAHGIYPPLLRADGVAGALRAAARRSPIPATVDAAGVGRIGADVEGVLYFCCVEAMRNAAKHGGPGTTVGVHVDVADGRVRFVVADTGRGLGPPAEYGGGLAAMRERLQVVDGAFTIEARPGGGTTVKGEIPVATT